MLSKYFILPLIAPPNFKLGYRPEFMYCLLFTDNIPPEHFICISCLYLCIVFGLLLFEYVCVCSCIHETDPRCTITEVL